MAEDVITLSRFSPAALASRRAGRRLDALLAERDSAALVAALPVQDLFHLVQEVGLADSHEVLALATPDQVQGLVDLSSWSGDRLKDEAVVPWLEALLEAGPEKLTEVWRGLDQELTALLLQRWVRVYNLIEEELPDWEEPPFIPTPDRFFMLKITAERPETIRVVEMLVDRLYRVDAELARHTIRSAASEPASELEEMALRWRSGRLQDLGYATLEEALEVYRPIDLASVQIGEQTADAPGEGTLPLVLADPTLRQPFLARVLARVTRAAEAQRLEAALVTLLNLVLAANRVEPSDTAGLTAAAAAGAATLSLGLETVARGDEARAEEALATIALVRLHRVGHTVTKKLADLARVLAPRAARAEEPYLSLVTALRRRRAELARVLDDPPGVGSRPFGDVAEVRRAARALAVLAAQVSLVREALDVDPAALGAAVTLGDVARTAMVHVLFGEPPSATPLALEAVRRFAASLTAGRLPDGALATIRAAFDALLAAKKIAAPQEYDAALSGFRDDLEREFGRLDPTLTPDKRFIGGLLIE